MRKRIALILACLLLLSAAPLALAQTVAPGAEVTLEFPVSGANYNILDINYTLSAGLSFVRGEMSGLSGGGKAGSKQALYVSIPASEGGTFKLTVKAAADATGEQKVEISVLRGYVPQAWTDLTGKGVKTVTVASVGTIVRGDATNNGVVDEFDIAAIIGYLVDDIPCNNMENANANGRDGVDEYDIAWIIGYLVD